VQNFAGSLPHAVWRFESENGTSSLALVGRSWLNGTGKDHGLALRITFDDISSGQFMSGVDEDALMPVFSFNFHHPLTSVATSFGTYHGLHQEADYVMQIASTDRFTLAIFPRSRNLAHVSSKLDREESQFGPTGHLDDLVSSEEVLYLIGHRVKVEVEKTFLQKYGTMLLLGGMLLLNGWLKTRSAATPTRPATPAAVPAAGASRVTTKREGARIEDITEESASSGNKKSN